MAIIATTTSSSISVKARRICHRLLERFFDGEAALLALTAQGRRGGWKGFSGAFEGRGGSGRSCHAQAVGKGKRAINNGKASGTFNTKATIFVGSLSQRALKAIRRASDGSGRQQQKGSPGQFRQAQ
jgi:hypothetical protein